MFCVVDLVEGVIVFLIGGWFGYYFAKNWDSTYAMVNPRIEKYFNDFNVPREKKED